MTSTRVALAIACLAAAPQPRITPGDAFRFGGEQPAPGVARPVPDLYFWNGQASSAGKGGDMGWNNNVFINFLPGGGGDLRIERQTKVLCNRVGADEDEDIFTVDTTPPIVCPPGMAARLGALDAGDRLYMRGHGDWKMRTIGGMSAIDVALLMKRAGLGPVGLVSITACQGARATSADATHETYQVAKQAREALLAESGYSFAGELHKYLRGVAGVSTEAHGRIYNLDIVEAGSNKPGHEYLEPGQKTVRVQSGADAPHVHHKLFTKIRFYWQGNTQARAWVTYD